MGRSGQRSGSRRLVARRCSPRPTSTSPYDFDSLAKAARCSDRGAIIVVDDSTPVLDASALSSRSSTATSPAASARHAREGQHLDGEDAQSASTQARPRRWTSTIHGPSVQDPHHRQLRRSSGWADAMAMPIRLDHRESSAPSSSAHGIPPARALPSPPEHNTITLPDRRSRGPGAPRNDASADAASGDVEIPVFCYDPS